jgi:hypothetical protein
MTYQMGERGGERRHILVRVSMCLTQLIHKGVIQRVRRAVLVTAVTTEENLPERREGRREKANLGRTRNFYFYFFLSMTGCSPKYP